MFKIFKLIQKLFFNYRDHIRIKINKKDPKLHTLVKALSKENPHLQLLFLIENDSNCDALEYVLKDNVHPFKIWYKGDMLVEKDIVFNLINDFFISDLPHLPNRWNQEENTVFHTIVQQRLDLLPDLCKGLSDEQFFYLLNMKNGKGNTVLYDVKQHGLDKALKLFEKFSNNDLISFFNTQLSTSKIDKDGNSEVNKNTILHSLAKSAPGLLSNLFKRFSKEQLLEEQLIDCLFAEDNDGKAAMDTVIENCSDSSLEQLVEDFSGEYLASFLSMQPQTPKFAKNDSASCNEDSILHTIVLRKPHLLPNLLKKFSSEQLTSLLKIQDDKKNTVLHVIAKSKPELFLNLLVEDLQDKQVIDLLSVKNDEGRTPLYYNVLKKYSMKNYNNPLDFVLRVIEKVDLKSCTDSVGLKPFIDLLNIKCDGDVTLDHMILQEPYGDKWKEVVEQIPNCVLKQALETHDDFKNIESDKLKVDVFNQKLGEIEVLKISILKMKKLTFLLDGINVQLCKNSNHYR